MKKSCLHTMIAFLLILTMALPLFACVSNDGPAETTPPLSETTAEVTIEETTTEEITTEEETEAPLPTEVHLPEAYATAKLIYTCDDGSIMHYFTGKTVEDFHTVCTYYKDNGFLLYAQSEKAGNHFATLVGDGPMAHVYWLKDSGELNIVLSDTAAHTLPPQTPDVTDGDIECSIVQLEDNGNVNGMCYVIQLKDGSFIIYDGSYTSQTRKLEQYLTEHTPGDGKPLIRAWVLTHSHADHYPTFQAYARQKKFKDKLTVEHVIFSPLNDERFPFKEKSNEIYFSTELYNDMASFPGAKLVFAHTGMEFTFCNLKMEVLMTPETLYKDVNTFGNFNNTSVVTRLYDEDYSALILGDIALKGANRMSALYGDYLKSDICQVSHHGVEDVPLSFYETVKASILYYPCNQSLYNLQDRNDDVRIALENRDFTKEILIAGCGQYRRVWGTTFAPDAPLSIPDYVFPSHKQDPNS